MKNHIFLILFLSYSLCFFAQKVNSNAGVLLKTEMTLGNQNDWFKIGLFGFGAINYKGVAVESGFSIGLSQLLKRHTIKLKGKSYSYEFFGLVGKGQNHDLMGAAVSTQNNSFTPTPYNNLSFTGVGFGFEKEILPKGLKAYSLKRGKFLIRYSKENTNLHLVFLNDFKAGSIMPGEGTDYGETGSLIVGYTKHNSLSEIHQIGFGLTLFTPQPDYSLTPRNYTNSDYGSKNVWFTKSDYPNTFYSNAYLFGTFQKNNYSFHSKLGINSQKMGAAVQNKLHDGFGLNPRFPWNTDKKNKIYYEIETAVFAKDIAND